MYKNIIFDLGGVVVEFIPREFLMERLLNEELENEIFNITFGSKAWRDMDCGLITREEGNKIMMADAKEIGRAYEVSMLINDWEDMLRSKEDTVRLMAMLARNGYNIYYLSNIAHDILAKLKARRFWPVFKGGVASCDAKLVKPDPKIFLGTMRKFSLSASECIFIDDTLANVKSAEKVGIKSLQFTSASQLARDLTALGVQIRVKK